MKWGYVLHREDFASPFVVVAQLLKQLNIHALFVVQQLRNGAVTGPEGYSLTSKSAYANKSILEPSER